MIRPITWTSAIYLNAKDQQDTKDGQPACHHLPILSNSIIPERDTAMSDSIMLMTPDAPDVADEGTVAEVLNMNEHEFHGRRNFPGRLTPAARATST
jgi:hypothetical protein